MNKLEQEPAKEAVESALLYALWHHQGASSNIGQPIRKMLGIGQYDHLTPNQIQKAKLYTSPPNDRYTEGFNAGKLFAKLEFADNAKDFATLERAIRVAALMDVVKLPRWDVHQYDNLMEADAGGEYIKVSDIQSLITEDDKDALRGFGAQIAGAVWAMAAPDKEIDTTALLELVDRVLESK